MILNIVKALFVGRSDMPQIIKYMLLEDEGIKGLAPKKMTEGSSCYDLYLPKSVWLQPQRVMTIPLLIAFDVHQDYDIELFPRSSLQTKYGVISSTSIIDSDYKKGIHAILYNTTKTTVKLLGNTRVMQFKLKKKYSSVLEEVDSIKDTGRGGLGSTDEQ